MVLVDSSVWIDFLANAPQTDGLEKMLEAKDICCHDLVYLELMLGHLGPRREQVLVDIDLLPKCEHYSSAEVRSFIEGEKLYGKGLSLVDAHLLYSCLADGHSLWTHDHSLFRIANHYRKAFKF